MNTPIRHARSLRSIHARIAGEGPAAIELPSPRAVDPDEIEPGLVIFERFCVVGNVWREPRGWRVRVTDLGRELGQPPHHRLDLHVLDTERSDPVALRVAIGLHSGEDRRVLAIGEGEDLVAMVTPPAEGRPPDRDDDARVASVLVSLLADGHARGVTGWRFDPVDLRVEGHRVRFDAWRHLDGVHFGDEPAARADVIALVGVLRALGHAVRAPTDGSLTAESLQTLITGEEPSPRRGGNEADLERVRAAVDASRSRGPGRLLLLGPDRLRFLDDLHHDLVSRGCVVVMVRVAGQMPCTSLCLLAEAVDRALVQVGPTRRAALTARLEEEPPAVQQVQRRSDHHARVLARVIAELGTLDRPAVVLVDDLREADDGLLAVLAQTPRGPHPVTWVLGTSGEVPLDAERIELAPASSPRQDRPLLSPLARRVALLRAIRPEHVSVSWLGEVTGEERAAVLDATRELIEAELVDEVTGGGLQWTDDRARDVVLASADPVELAAAHRGVATWLDGVDADSALVEWAWHSEHAAPGGVDSDLASRHLLAGTRLLEQGDVTRAAWHLGRARDRATPQDDAILACAHEGLAEVAVSLGDGAEAKRCWMAAVEAVDDPHQRLALANRALESLLFVGHLEPMIPIGEQALSLAGQAPVAHGAFGVLAQCASALVWTLLGVRARVPAPDRDQLAVTSALLGVALARNHPMATAATLARAWWYASGSDTAAAAVTRAVVAMVLVPLRPAWALAQLERSERCAVATPATLASVQHLRGHGEIAAGRHAEGVAALRRAADSFDGLGESGASLVSRAVALLYDLDRLPTADALVRIDELSAVGSSAANVGPLLHAMRVRIEVRAGLLTDLDLLAAIDEGTATSHTPTLAPVARSWSTPAGEAVDAPRSPLVDALLALALLDGGQVAAASTLAERARSHWERLGVRLPVDDLVPVACARARLATGDRPGARRALREGGSRLERGPWRLQARTCRAALVLAERGPSAATPSLRAAADRALASGELWTALLALERLPGAQAEAGALRATLGRPTALTRSSIDDRTGSVADDGWAQGPTSSKPPSALTELVLRLQEVVGDTLPGELTVEIDPGADIDGDDALLELLLVEAVLHVRDATDASGMSLTVTSTHEGSTRIAVRGDGSPLTRASAVATQLATKLEATVELTRDGLTLTFPPSQRGRGDRPLKVAVVSSDRRVVATLVAAILRQGASAAGVESGEAPPPDTDVVLVDSDQLAALPQGPWRVVELVPRARVRTEAPPPTRRASLSVPFLVGELEAALGGSV